MKAIEMKIKKMGSVTILSKLRKETFSSEERNFALQILLKRNVNITEFTVLNEKLPTKGSKAESIYKLIITTEFSSYKIAKMMETYPSVVLGVANRYNVHRFSKN